MLQLMFIETLCGTFILPENLESLHSRNYFGKTGKIVFELINNTYITEIQQRRE